MIEEFESEHMERL